MIRLDFHITGAVEQTCDRSLDDYDEPVDTRQTMLLKFGDHNEELSDEIELIERNTATINVAHYIFEFISLSLPMKRLHPRFGTKMTETIYKTVKSSIGPMPKRMRMKMASQTLIRAGQRYEN